MKPNPPISILHYFITSQNQNIIVMNYSIPNKYAL